MRRNDLGKCAAYDLFIRTDVTKAHAGEGRLDADYFQLHDAALRETLAQILGGIAQSW